MAYGSASIVLMKLKHNLVIVNAPAITTIRRMISWSLSLILSMANELAIAEALEKEGIAVHGVTGLMVGYVRFCGRDHFPLPVLFEE